MAIKNKNEENLVYVEKKSEDTSSLTVAFDVLDMYDRDFNLTISEIANILQCERQWVAKYVQNNVKHIFLNDKYREFLMSINAQYGVRDYVYLKDYYYFSRKDFYKWLKKNTVATKQTQVFDINLYCIDLKEYDSITKEFEKAMREAKAPIVKAGLIFQYEHRINSILSDEGRKIYSYKLGDTNRGKIKEVKLKRFELPEKLVSIKNLKGDSSLELVYRRLFRNGAIKYTIANSLVRYSNSIEIDCEVSDYPHLITIPYEVYLKICSM